MVCLKETVCIHALQGEEKDTKLADALVQMVILHTDNSNFDNATQMLDKAMNIYEKSIGANAVGKAFALKQIGRICFAKRRV